MNWGTIVLIALALPMDAFAVSIASGIAIKHLRLHHALTIAAWFGTFQAVMPLLGWLAGIRARLWIEGADHWVAFGLLAFIGGKMVYESFKIEAVEARANPLDVWVLFVLSVATSVDALAAGFSFAVLPQPISIMAPALVIGGITFLTSFAGVWLGERGGHFFEKRIEFVAGLILIGIGARILIAHLMA